MDRFEKDDVGVMAHGLGMPGKMVLQNGTVTSGLESVLITLRRLAYPNRLADMVQMFGRSEPELSMIFNEFIDQNHGHRVESLNPALITRERLQNYSDAIQLSSPLENCWGFIDGSLRLIARPGHQQELTFSGHNRTHGLNYQYISTPDGMVVHLFGPMEGKRHDAALLRESSVLPQLQLHMNDAAGNPLYLYGDMAYPLHSHLICPFKGGNLTAEEHEFNRQMSACRQCVEWSFNKTLQLFAFLDFKKNQKVHLHPVGMYYKVATILSNCHSCIYGNQTSDFSNVAPPSLGEYLS